MIGDVERQTAFGGVAADKRYTVFAADSKKTAAERIQPFAVQLGQRGTEQHPSRHGTHRRHVGQIDRQNFMRHILRCVIRKKMSFCQ